MAYATAAEVKDKDLSRLVTQAGWLDADVNDRIAEGDAVIDALFSSMGYAIPFLPTLPPLIVRLSILYGRYACLRDIFQNFAPSQSGAAGFQHMLDQFNAIIEQLKENKLFLVDSTGAVIVNTPTNTRVQTNTANVKRALTMGDPESAIMDPLYSHQDVTGDPT